MAAKVEVEDSVRALDTGADDFMVKPFKIKELVARINAVDRRKSKLFVDRVCARSAVEINRDLHTVCSGGREVHLRKKEFDLFEMLFVNLNNVLTRTAIFEKIWSDKLDTNMESLDSHIFPPIKDRV